jgi:hypothetical protein
VTFIWLNGGGPPETVAVVPRSTEFRQKRHMNGQFRSLWPLASTIAPYLQMINYRGRFSPIGGI